MRLTQASTAKITLAAGLALLSAGCALSDNPREGGLFSYSPSKYEQRQEERQTTLTGLKQETEAEKAAGAKLEQERKDKAQELANLRKQTSALATDIDAMSAKLDGIRAGNAAQETRLNELKTLRKNLSNSVAQLEKSAGSEADGQARLDELKKQLRDLEQEADALSHM
jgi:chromosome segregation ATPase